MITDIAKDSSAFILEDNTVLAMEMEKMLCDLGFAETHAFPSVQAARDQIGDYHYDLAILDINLGVETSFKIAQELQRLGVPIVFVSGYDSDHHMPDSLAQMPRLIKPVNRDQLSRSISKARDQSS